MSPGATRQLLSGWGRSAPTAADVSRVTDAADVVELIADALSSKRKVLARGLGRSYGDAAQSAGGMVLDMTALNNVLDSDLDTGWVRVGAGVSLDSMMRWLVPKGWWVPVTPGTRYVTVGGAIAADIHGKNHHVDGTFCSHVKSFTLATPSGVREVSPNSDPELFWATAGGMGLTGIVLDATIQLVAVETSLMLVDTERASDLDDCLERMTARDDEYRYSVAWIDCVARGRKLGRSVLTRAHHARRSDVPQVADPLRFDPKVLADVPITPPNGLLNPLSVAAFNEVWYRKSPKSRVAHQETIASYFHPLDGVGGWNRLYGPSGFLQYQFVVPFGAERALRTAVERLSNERVASFLAVLKRFGASNPGPLSFPKDGWTLALDLPARGDRLGRILGELDEVVAEAGGRVYLAKDSRLRPELLSTMYPRLGEWQAVRERVDPDMVFVSDMAMRLGILPRTGTKTKTTRRRARKAG